MVIKFTRMAAVYIIFGSRHRLSVTSRDIFIPNLPISYKDLSLPYSSLGYPTLTYPTLAYPTLPNPALTYPTLPCLTLPYPTLP